VGNTGLEDPVDGNARHRCGEHDYDQCQFHLCPALHRVLQPKRAWCVGAPTTRGRPMDVALGPAPAFLFGSGLEVVAFCHEEEAA